MNEWLVCSTRDGHLSLMTREEREHQLNLCSALGEPVPSFILKVFPIKKDAVKYYEDMKLTNKIINNL